MAHARTTVRAELVAALIAASTLAGSRVFTESRSANFSDADVPLIRVLVFEEAQTGTTMGGGRANRHIDRKLPVQVEYICKQADDFIEDADDALALIEIAFANLTSAVIKDITPQGLTFTRDTQGDLPVYVAVQQFEILYITTQGDPATAL